MPCFRLPYAQLFIAALVLGIVLFGHPSQAASVGRNTPVNVAEAKIVVVSPVRVAGEEAGRQEVRLAAEVAGKLVMVKEVGTRVKEGDVVARIDPSLIKLKIEELKAQVEADRAQLEYLKSEVRRNRSLATQDKAAQIRLDEVRVDREVARNELRLSRVYLKRAREALRRHVIRSPFAAVVVELLKRRGERVEVGDDVLRLLGRSHSH